jgi:hypothetical protein
LFSSVEQIGHTDEVRLIAVLSEPEESIPSMDSKSSLKGGDSAPLATCAGEVAELRPEVGERYFEWQAGVLRAERPAVSAMCRRGDCGS